MALPKTTQDRITSDADDYATRMVWVNQNPKGEEQLFYEYISATSYQACANAYAERVQNLVDDLKKAIEKMKECESVYNVPCGSVIVECEETLQKWAGKEVAG